MSGDDEVETLWRKRQSSNDSGLIEFVELIRDDDDADDDEDSLTIDTGVDEGIDSATGQARKRKLAFKKDVGEKRVSEGADANSKKRDRNKSVGQSSNKLGEWSVFLKTDFETILTGFNLEQWWKRSGMPTRINVLLLALLFAFALMHLIMSVIFFAKFFKETIRSPYVCETESCQKASQWLTTTMNTKMDPCENFYEFMCGNYHNESENAKEGHLLEDLIMIPAFKVEFGANSILAKMLRNYRNDPTYDQAIRFYQACLDEPKREDSSLASFYDRLEGIFGTRNMSDFEYTSLSMEQVGANMLKCTGDATYINMAFYTYPHILILRPSRKIHEIFEHPGKHTDELVLRVFDNLLPKLGVTDKKRIVDSYNGVKVFGSIESVITDQLKYIQFPKKLEDPPTEFVDKVKAELGGRGLCPPMGIQLNIRKVLRLFIQEEFRLEFIDLMALKYFLAFEICFAEDPSKFTFLTVDYPKTSFVAMWLFGIFWDSLLSMNTKTIMTNWTISIEDLPTNELVMNKHNEANQHIELRCMLDMSMKLGYLPTIRYLTSKEEDPMEYIQRKRDEIQELYEETSKWFSRIPPSEMEKNMEVLGKLILGRGLHVDVMMPLVSGVLDKNAATDNLNFGQDHLRNSFLAIRYTVERARQDWLGSTNFQPTPRWWGLGGPRDMQEELFDIRQAFLKASDFVEINGTANSKQWYKFLGRPLPNYALFLLTVFDEPYIREALFLEMGGMAVKVIRSIYTLIQDPLYLRYPSLNDKYWRQLIYYGEPEDNLNRSCVVLHHYLTPKSKDEPEPPFYNYTLIPNIAGGFAWHVDQSYMGVLTLKQTLQLLRDRRKKLSSKSYHWRTPAQTRKQRMQRLLPGNMLSKYTEEQLFFMAYVRNTCRGSWRKHDDALKEKRYRLETSHLAILMQTEEFAQVWKCKKDAFMSNKGQPRCVQFVP